MSGSLTLDDTTITDVEIEVDMTTLQSDDSDRDGQMERQGLQTSQFPTASFELTTPIELDQLPAEGTEITVEAVGDLTLHGVTKQVTIPLQATLQDGVIVVTGSLDVQFADFGDRQAHELLGALGRGPRDHRDAAVLQPFLGLGSAISSTHSPRSNA